jgi:hypothetical protein
LATSEELLSMRQKELIISMDLTAAKYIFGSLEQVNVVLTNYY